MVDALRNMVDAVRPGGDVLDLQVIRPDPVVELGGADIAEIDGEPLFATADVAVAAIDGAIADGTLVEVATDDHDVRKHYPSGADLIADLTGKPRRLTPQVIARVSALTGPVALRERCRLRRLVVTAR